MMTLFCSRLPRHTLILSNVKNLPVYSELHIISMPHTLTEYQSTQQLTENEDT